MNTVNRVSYTDMSLVILNILHALGLPDSNNSKKNHHELMQKPENKKIPGWWCTSNILFHCEIPRGVRALNVSCNIFCNAQIQHRL